MDGDDNLNGDSDSKKSSLHLFKRQGKVQALEDEIIACNYFVCVQVFNLVTRLKDAVLVVYKIKMMNVLYSAASAGFQSSF